MLLKELDKQRMPRKTRQSFEKSLVERQKGTHSEKPANVKQEGCIPYGNFGVDVVDQTRKGWWDR